MITILRQSLAVFRFIAVASVSPAPAHGAGMEFLGLPTDAPADQVKPGAPPATGPRPVVILIDGITGPVAASNCVEPRAVNLLRNTHDGRETQLAGALASARLPSGGGIEVAAVVWYGSFRDFSIACSSSWQAGVEAVARELVRHGDPARYAVSVVAHSKGNLLFSTALAHQRAANTDRPIRIRNFFSLAPPPGDVTHVRERELGVEGLIVNVVPPQGSGRRFPLRSRGRPRGTGLVAPTVARTREPPAALHGPDDDRAGARRRAGQHPRRAGREGGPWWHRCTRRRTRGAVTPGRWGAAGSYHLRAAKGRSAPSGTRSAWFDRFVEPVERR